MANMFTIRTLDPNSTTAGLRDFLYSDSVHATAKAKGWWDPRDGLLDFTKVGSVGIWWDLVGSGGIWWDLAGLWWDLVGCDGM